jgi:glutamate N-acetyltransferase/amino-acid N-acetyltransferase
VSVTAPAGFRAAGVTAGLKASGGPDLALVVNDGPGTAAAGVFTRNRVQAAPVRWSRQVLRGGAVRAVVLNSGGANACTGPAGFQDTHATAEHVAATLTGLAAGEVGAGEVAVCSTGLIGERLPMPKLLAGVTAATAALSRDGGEAAAEAILTTDTRPKTVVRDGGGYTVGGMAKGAGMLAPQLATMLCALTTDAVADPATLDAALREAVRVSFDRLDSDGCLSTNDTVLLLASGASGATATVGQLTEVVTAACLDLTRQLLADAEGHTKRVAIEVVDAVTESDAVEVGRAVARSNLVKTALFGADPNWGRILAAVGTTAAAFESDRLDVAVNGVWVCRAGGAAAGRSAVDLSGPEVTVRIVLHAGEAAATVWTNDLSHGYVHENSAYST